MIELKKDITKLYHLQNMISYTPWIETNGGRYDLSQCFTSFNRLLP